MNTKTLSKSIFSDVNISIIKDSQDNIRDSYNYLAQTQYQEFKAHCTSIKNHVDETLEVSQDSIIKTRAQMDNVRSIEFLNDLIRKKEEELESAPPSEQEEIQEDIDRFREQGDEKINEKLAVFTTNSETLTSNVGNIEFFEFKQEVDEEKAELDEKLTKILGYIEEYEAKIAKTTKEYDSINVMMDVMEDYNFMDFVSDIIPSAEEIGAMMDTGDPRYAAVIFALGVMKDLIGVLGDGFSYIRLEETRDYLWNLFVFEMLEYAEYFIHQS